MILLFVILTNINVNGSESFDYRLRDWDEDYIENEFNVNIRKEPFLINFRSLARIPAGTEEYENFFWKSFSSDFEHLEFKVGNYYLTSLNGLLIRAYNNPELNNDKSLYGVHLKIKSKHLNLSGFTGRPRNILYNDYDYRIVNDTTNNLSGINLLGKLKGQKLKLGYLRMKDQGDLSPSAFTELYGSGIEVNYSITNLFLYYIHKGGCRPYLGGEYNGNGINGSLSLYAYPFGLQIFVIYYDSIALGGNQYRYNDPRPINHSEISINRGMDERGLSAIIDYTLSDYYIQGHLSNIQTSDKNKVVEDHYVELEIPLMDYNRLTLNYEYLYEKAFDPHFDMKIENKPGAMMEVSYGNYGIQLEGEFNYIKTDTLNYWEGYGGLSVSRGPVTITGSYRKRSELISYLEDRVRWRKLEVNYRAPNNLTLTAMVGEVKGGLVCSGGVCRWESPFEGVRFTLKKIF